MSDCSIKEDDQGRSIVKMIFDQRFEVLRKLISWLPIEEYCRQAEKLEQRTYDSTCLQEHASVLGPSNMGAEAE